MFARSRLLPGLVCALGLLWPLIFLAIRGVSPANLAEESTGYRYFGSLAPFLGEQPVWTPQGHAPALVQMVLQALVTLVGFPLGQLHPRIDVWTFLAAGIPSVAAGIALVWASRPIGSRLGAWLLALLVVVAGYEQRGGGGLVLTFPDYLGWATVFALVTIGWCLRLVQPGAAATPRSWIALALFGGLALGVKPTYLVYPLTVGVALLAVEHWHPRAIVRAGMSGINAVLIGLVILCAATLRVLSLALILQQSGQLQALDATGRAGFTDTPLEWLLGEATRVPDLAALTICLPALLIVLLVILPGRRGVVLGLLGGVLVLDVYAYQRFYFVTISELDAFGLAAIGLIGTFVAPRVPRRAVVGGALAGVLGCLAVTRMASFATDLAPAFAADDLASRQVQAAIDAHQRAIFLIPNNNLRPMTVDSAIQKGGGALTEREPWTSPGVERLFGARRAYLMGDTLAPRVEPVLSLYDQTFPTPLDLVSFDLLVYVANGDAGGDEQSRTLLKEYFGVTLDGWRCDERVPAWSPNIVGRGAPFHSSRWELQATSIVLCTRR